MARKVLDADYDFIGFTYNGYHSIDDLKIYRTSNGNRYSLEMIPNSKDTTAEVPDGDGMYLFESYHMEKTIEINFAFDSLYDEDIRRLTEVFNGQGFGELIFDEWPYKAYNAKITTVPTIKYICFDTEDGRRIYKGEGTLNFKCIPAYAHTPHKTNIIPTNVQSTYAFGVDVYLTAGTYYILSKDENNTPTNIKIDLVGSQNHFTSDFYENKTLNFIVPNNTNIARIIVGQNVVADKENNILNLVVVNVDTGEEKILVDNNYSGKSLKSYERNRTKSLWEDTAGLVSDFVHSRGENHGELDAPFIFKYSGVIQNKTEFRMGDKSIVVFGSSDKKYSEFEWRSENGLVLAKTNDGVKKPIYFEGKSMAKIPTSGLLYSQIYVLPYNAAGKAQEKEYINTENTKITLEYDYWYY